MSVPALNVDILFYVMAHATRKTLLKMMRASRDLHRGGIKYLLRKSPDLENEGAFRSFLLFCDARGQVAEIAYRMSFLRGLTIDLDRPHCFDYDSDDNDMLEHELSSMTQALTRLFTSTIRVYAHNFTRLVILNCDSLCAADPNLSVAIASLTTLTHLNLCDATENCFKLLGSLKSCLVEAHIGMDIDLIDPPDGDPMAFLRRSESSLTNLSLYLTGSPSGAACYPHVHTLDICNLDIPTTRHYATTFPNLRVLTANECMTRYSYDQGEWARARNLNVVQQARDGSWGSLQSYVGSILFLYLFGLACHVPYVHVYAGDEHESMIIRQVRAVVVDTRPEHLIVDIPEVSHFFAQAEDFIALSKDAEFQAVKVFVLNMCLCAGDYKTDMEAMLEYIFTVVSSSSSLVGFSLKINWPSIRCRTTKPRVGSSGKNQRPKPSRAQVFLESLDANAVADRLLRSCECLQAVKVVLEKATAERGPVDIFDRKASGPGGTAPQKV